MNDELIHLHLPQQFVDVQRECAIVDDTVVQSHQLPTRGEEQGDRRSEAPIGIGHLAIGVEEMIEIELELSSTAVNLIERKFDEE